MRHLAARALALAATVGPALAQCDEQKLLASDSGAGQHFGFGVSVFGDAAVVGAFADDEIARDAGAAYVYEKGPGGWVEVQKLTASDATENTLFGSAVSLWGDTALIGAHGDGEVAPAAGAVYVFERTPSGWVETAKLVAPDGATGDGYGFKVAIAGDRALVGAFLDEDPVIGPQTGSAYLYERTPSGWRLVVKLLASDADEGDRFGHAVSIWRDRIVVGAYKNDDHGDETGSAYVFEETESGWVEVQKLLASDAAGNTRFGRSASIWGDRLLIGTYWDNELAQRAGAAYVFERVGSTWVETTKLQANDGAQDDQFGTACFLSRDRALILAPNASGGGVDGAAYLFQHGPAGWSQIAKVHSHGGTACIPFQGSVSIWGERMFVSGYGDPESGACGGSARAFRVPRFATPFCFGVGCPCGNDDPVRGCAASPGTGALSVACGSASVAADDLVLSVTSLPASVTAVVYMGSAEARLPFGDGLRCVGRGSTGLFRFPAQTSSAAGGMRLGPGIVAHSRASFGSAGRIAAGQTWHFQTAYFDSLGPCAGSVNSSNALAVTFSP